MTATDGTSPTGRRRRRPRDEVARALVDATAELLAERSSGQVTVRDIAARADVNVALIHRYFGSKRNLVGAAVAEAQRRMVAEVDGMPDALTGATSVFHAALQEHQLVATLARATLDGALDDLPPGQPAIGRLVERFEAEAAARGHRPRYDLRLLVACLSAATMGYALFGGLIRSAAGLGEEPEEQVEAAIIGMLQDLAGSALGDAT